MVATSGHFEWASTNTINVFPWKGPVKSTCSRDQGFVGHSHGWRGATGGAFLFAWHGWHCCTTLSKSASIRGHHTMPLAKAFIRDAPGCPSCRIRITSFLPASGITTRLPHRRQSPWTLSSVVLVLYSEVLGLSGIPFQLPLLTASLTRARTRSLFVQFRMEETETTLSLWSRVSSSKTVSPGMGTSPSEFCSGSLLRASAFACNFPALNSMV